MTIGLVIPFIFAMVYLMFMDEINLHTTLISIEGLPLYMQFMLHARIRSVKIRWKTLGSSLSILGLINLGGIL
jgi:hypothetical protein